MIELDKIYCCDCLEGMKAMPSDSVDIVVTSPPYNFCLRVRGEEYTHRTSGEMMHGMPMNKYKNGLSDSLEMDEYFEWQKEVIEEMLRVCKGNIFYNIQVITGNKQAVFRLIGYFCDRIKDVLVWDKQFAEPAMHEGCLNNEFELILIFNKHDCKGRLFHEAQFERGTMSNVIRLNKHTGGGHISSCSLSNRLAKDPYPVLRRWRSIGARPVHGQWHHGHCMYQGEAALRRLRAQRGVLQDGVQAD